MVLVYLALLAGWFVGGIFLGRWLEDRKVQRELKAIVIGFQIGMVNQCPVCKQQVTGLKATSHSGEQLHVH